jgi:hypothetical protein
MNYRSRALVSVLDQTASHSTEDGACLSAKDIDVLPMLKVIYELAKTEGMEVAGDPESAFATFDRNTGVLDVYSKTTSEYIGAASHRTLIMQASLEYAQAEGASFSVFGDTVTCVLKNVTAQGGSYGEAAFRAFAKFNFEAQGGR